jgi:hypothetical protein
MMHWKRLLFWYLINLNFLPSTSGRQYDQFGRQHDSSGSQPSIIQRTHSQDYCL